MMTRNPCICLFFALLAHLSWLPFSAAQGLCNGGHLGPNVFPDGGLGTGVDNILPYDPGIAPGYWYTLDPPPVDGAYCLANSTAGWDWFAELFWLEIGDNSHDPNGYMMVVNANYGPGIFYEQTVDVCENTPYLFSADIINLFLPEFPDAILPNVDFLINGNVVYSTGDIPMNMQWNTYEFAFESPGATQFTFALRNNAPGGFGNDLALDNISLRFCGPQIMLPDIASPCSGLLELNPDFSSEWPNSHLQWQSSSDGGQNWVDLPGETTCCLSTPVFADGQQFRLLVAGSPANLANPYCRAESNAVTIDLPIVQTILQDTICAGETILVAGHAFALPGDHLISIPASNGCDSLIALHLQVLQPVESFADVALCAGSAYLFDNQLLTTSGTYTAHYTATSGCDSVAILNLTIEPLISTEISRSICEGESVEFGGEILSAPGLYTSSTTLPNGCDSTVFLHLAVLPNIFSELTLQLCKGEGYLLGNEWLDETGTYFKTFASAAGCDSTVAINLEVLPDTSSVFIQTICQGDAYLFGNQWLTAAGVYEQSFTASNDCDSVVELWLDVLPEILLPIEVQICQGEAYIFGNNMLVQSGFYQENYSATSGCDSIVQLTLVVLPEYQQEMSAHICQGDHFVFGNQVLFQAGDYVQVFSAENGCDSTVLLHLQVYPPIIGELWVDLCEGEPYFGAIYDNDIVLQDTFSSATTGCDSILITHISIHDVPIDTVHAFRCWGSSFNGIPLEKDTVFIFKGQTLHGCDSTAIYAVRVGEELVPGFSAPSTICKAETVQLFPGDFAQYIWSTGDTIPAITAANTGIYAVTVVDEDGCTATAAHPLLVAELAISAEHKEPDCYGYDNGEIYLDASGSLPPFLFSFDNMPFQSARKYIGLKAGLYNVEVKDSLGCKQEGTVYLHSPPEFILDVNCETALDLGGNTIIQTQSSLPIVDYHWSPKAGLDCSDCPSPRAKPLSSTLYTLSAMSEQGCEAQAQVFIAVEKSREVYVPNAFSPNGDGINDFFSIYPGPSVLKINYLKIFDRWGDAVFSAWNIPPFHAAGHWDGSYRGRPMQPGAFAWFAEIEFLDGHITLLKGDVVLLK